MFYNLPPQSNQSLLKLLEEVNHREEWVQHRRYRVVHHPLNNLYAAIINRIWYPLTKKNVAVKAHLFFGETLNCQLPAAAHYYLFGMKSHNSEIRLTRFLLRQVSQHKTFFDIGAHLGYYTLLAQHQMKKDATVVSFEASANTFNWLKKNIQSKPNITAVHAAVCNTKDEIDFVELPARHAESNSILNNRKDLPTSKVQSIRIDDYCRENTLYPTLIKMDVEGAEAEALMGMNELLEQEQLTLIIECWKEGDSVTPTFLKAKNLLVDAGFTLHVIDDNGNLFETNDELMMMHQHHIESDNVVFTKTRA